MIDLIDLMNEVFTPCINDLDKDIRELYFVNDAGDHDVYTTINTKQMKILRQNIFVLYKKLNSNL